MKMKLFTLEEANRLIPVLESLFRDFQIKYRKMEESSLQWEVHQRTEAPPSPSSRSRKTREELTRLEQEVLEVIRLIEQVGCVIRDPHEGLVDFPGVRGQEPVYLCWKLGEGEIGFYHGVEEGFKGRKPIA